MRLFDTSVSLYVIMFFGSYLLKACAMSANHTDTNSFCPASFPHLVSANICEERCEQITITEDCVFKHGIITFEPVLKLFLKACDYCEESRKPLGSSSALSIALKPHGESENMEQDVDEEKAKVQSYLRQSLETVSAEIQNISCPVDFPVQRQVIEENWEPQIYCSKICDLADSGNNCDLLIKGVSFFRSDLGVFIELCGRCLRSSQHNNAQEEGNENKETVCPDSYPVKHLQKQNWCLQACEEVGEECEIIVPPCTARL